MKNIISSTVLLLAGILIVSSCKKYEEGPYVSLIPRAERIANSWRIDRAYDSEGNDISNNYDQYDLDLFSDNRVRLVATYTAGNFSYSTTTDGIWSLINSDEDLSLDVDDDEFDQVYKILKLQQDDLWLRDKGNGTELYLKPR